MPALIMLAGNGYSAFRPERFFADADRTNPEKVSALLPKGKFVLPYEDGALAGGVYVELRSERGYFGLLSVDPRRQRPGIGSRLIAAAEGQLPLADVASWISPS